jgi:TonB-linked SusC/RagA family outer membrane protein
MAVTRSVNNMVRSSTINGYNAIGIIRSAVTYVPMQFPDTTRADPRAESASNLASYGANPLRYTDEVHENDQATRGIGGVRGVISLPFGLAFDENIGANYERRTYGAYFPRTVNEGRTSNGDAVASGSEFSNLLSESLLRFNREVGGSGRVDAVGGFTYESDKSTWNSQEVQGFPDDILGGNVLQNGTVPQAPQSGLSTWQLASWLGRVNYALLDRYLFTATVRADGSSKFATNNKWATFPALAFAWRALDEPLLRNQHLLSELKLRASYGKSGNQAIGAYQSLPAIANVPMTLNEAVVPAYVVTQLGNPNLRWETTDQYDAGLDLGAWANRFTATVDVYRKNTYDLLQQITLAQSTGFGSAWINSGNVTNRGIELGANVDVLRSAAKGGLSWNVGANASHNVNRIESLGNGINQQFAGRLGAGGNLEAAPFIQKPGLSIGTMWGYRTAGIVSTPEDSAAYSKVIGSAIRVGDLKYVDVNGDGKITSADQTVIGDANPTWVWGVTNSVRFGNFDASALVTAVRGNQIINAERMRYLTLDGTINLPGEYVADSFDPVTNPNGRYPMIRQDRKSDARFSDIYIEDGSYVRLKNVQIGYNVVLPQVHAARVYVNAINLLTRTKYTGFDPEVSAFGGPDRPGVDLGSYPQARTISVGVNTTF